MLKCVPLVRLKGLPDLCEATSLVLDPYMTIDGHSSLSLRHVYDVERALSFLGHRIVRKPRDLRSHVQRIMLLLRVKDGDGLFGALVDLFIVLGERGGALKIDLLERSESFLEVSSRAFLMMYINKELASSDQGVMSIRGSILRDTIAHATPLVEARAVEVVEKDFNPLEEAHEFILYGQLDQALSVLEKSLSDNPNQPEVAHALREIYMRIGRGD